MVVESYQKDPEINQLLAELSLHPEGRDDFQLVKGVIRYKGKIWLGNYTEAKQAVMMPLHDSGIGRHSGRAATYHRIKSLFAWPRLKKDVYQYVQSCETCQQAKGEHGKTPGLLQPLPVPLQAWHTVSLYFIEGLP